MNDQACHVCGTGESVREVPGYQRLKRVTSDCRGWVDGGWLGVCAVCGTTQHRFDVAWHAQAKEVYSGYEIYHHSGGAEQAVFGGGGGGASGAAESRSSRLLSRLIGAVSLPASGRLLDVGCGNGALLREAGRHLRNWRLTGTELSGKHRGAVERLPGVERMVVGDVTEAQGRFEVVTLVHVLEHVVEPGALLAAVKQKMSEGGLMVVQCPDQGVNPFDLLIVDHATHFTDRTLGSLLGREGFEVVAGGSWVTKELSVVARAGGGGTHDVADARLEWERAAEQVRWLHAAVEWAQRCAETRSVGLFGTSIAATWMLGVLGERVGFFVDEDPSRVGKRYHGREVIAPEQVPAGSEVLMMLPLEVARRVVDRIGRAGVAWRLIGAS